MDDMLLKPGTVLAEKYRLGSVLGVGGMGTVYLAEHLALKAPVAIKVIDREVEEGDVALARFMREAQAAASLRSPHVVQILDYGMEGKRPFIVMEMLEGEPLSLRIKRVKRLTPADTLRVVSHVAKAVFKAHEADIIHRDLKPDNIFLVHNEGDEIAKVLDFGVAKVDATALDKEGHTRTGSLLGTPYYMSPEQAQGNKDIDPRSDLWALGVIAFECLTGKRPFSSDGLGDLVLQICIRDIPRPSDFGTLPPGFDNWFFKACAREPENRFQDARELTEELRSALNLKGDTIQEYRWSAAAPLPPSAPFEDLEDKTTQPDPDQERDLLDSSSSEDLPSDPRLSLDDAEEDARPSRADSQWEIVPHGRSDKNDALPAPLIPDVDALTGGPSSAGTSVLFVAVVAILLGGAIVFGVKQAGVELPSADKQPPKTRSTVPKAKSKAQSSEKTRSSPKNGPLKPKGKSSAQGKSRQGTSATPDNKEPAKSDSAQEESALDAIENQAEETLAERGTPKKDPEKGELTETAPESPSPDAKEEDPSQPEARLPDGLAAPPAPPPPPQ